MTSRFLANGFLTVATALLLCVLLFQAGVSGASTSKSSTIRECDVANLHITVQNGDGLHHGVEFIRFLNSSDTTCTLSGYPKVVAILDSTKGPAGDGYAPSPAGTTKAAADAEWAWAGGVDVDDVPPATFVAPVITLVAHNGVASSTLNWIDGPNGNGTCPAFNDVTIGLGDSSVTLFVRKFEPLCYEFSVTPIIRANTTDMFVKADYSRKRNDLSLAESSASNFSAAARTLHLQLEAPSKYSIYQEIQAATNVQDTSQFVSENTPWPTLNSSLSLVSRESDAYGIYGMMHALQGGYTRKVRNDYLRLLAGIKSLDNVLRHLS